MITAEEFKGDVLSWAKEVRVKPREVHIRKMNRKLASCSSRGRLTFDVSLLEETRQKRAKAILHELLHLKYPNHGKMFASLLEAYMRRAKKGFCSPAES